MTKKSIFSRIIWSNSTLNKSNSNCTGLGNRKIVQSLLLVLLCLPMISMAEGLFKASVRYAGSDLEGYLQTPAGGEPGRSDIRRPTFSELDIDHVDNFQFDFSYESGPHQYLFSSTISRVDENTVLKAPLLTQWMQFNTGDSVKSDIKLDWYRLGYLYRLDWSPLDRLALSIGGDFTGFDFHYQLDSAVNHVDRAYTKLGYRLGARADYALSDKTTLTGSWFEGLNAPGAVKIRTVDVNVSHRLWEGQFSGFGEFGVAWHEIDFEDEQRFPNHILVTTKPLVSLGLTVTR